MRSLTLAIGLALATVATSAACSKDKPAARRGPGEVSVDELALALGAGARAVDVNGTKLRTDVGVIPGAVLLSDYETFASTELPADKTQPLVFYCANLQCGASHEAASKALAYGYRDVKVLPAGILGWAEAGQRVDKL